MIDAVALLGPTASGKSAASLALADAFDVEIVSVDSALVYRGMDIGTAKPSRADLDRVPHHLIDIREPSQPYSAAEFASDAHAVCAQIHARGRLPLLVGGTMLYYKAFVSGLDDLPRADPALRATIDRQARALGWPAMHARLAQVDPSTAGRLAPNDAQRIQRALEVFESTGTPMSDLLGARSLAPAPKVFAISLEPSDRAWLHARIEARFDAMLEAGFLDEVIRLRNRGDLDAELPAMRAVGYRQAWAWCEGEYGDGPTARETLRSRGIAATRQLAKRQLTWLRSMAIDERIDACASDFVGRCIKSVQSLAHER